VGVEAVADVSQVLRELPRHGGMVLRPRAPDGEAGRHALLRACEARPRSHRYSVSPPFLATPRESTKRRSLGRLTEVSRPGLTVSTRVRARMRRSARRHTVRAWCR